MGKTDVLCTFNDLVKGSITKVCTCNHKDMPAVQDMIELLSGEAGVGDYTTPQAADQRMQEMHRQHEQAQKDMRELVGEMRKDAEKRQKELEQQIANSKKSGFRISLFPPGVSF